MVRPPMVVIALVVLAVAAGVWRLSSDDAPFSRPPAPGSESEQAAALPGVLGVDRAARGAAPPPGEAGERPEAGRSDADPRVPRKERRAQIVGGAAGRGATASQHGPGAATGAVPGAPSGAVIEPEEGTRIDPSGAPRQAERGRAPAAEEAVESGEVAEDAPKGEGEEDVLLSVPFDGDVDPVVGTPPAETSGVEAEGGEVEFTDEGVVSFPADGNFNAQAGTISFELVPNWAGSDETNNSLVQIYRGLHEWGNRMSLVKNFQSLRFVFVDDTGAERNVGLQIDDWLPGEARRITATWGDALMSLYVDGRLVGQNTYPGTLDLPPGAQIYIGYHDPASAYASVDGRIRNLQVYGRALGADEVGGR